MTKASEKVAASPLVGGGETTLHAHAGGAGAGFSSVKKTADQSLIGLTLVDVSELSFAVVADTYYHFRFIVLFRTALATVGLVLGLTCPAFTRFGATVRIPIAAAGAGGELQGWIQASGGSVIGTAVAVKDTDYIAIVDGVILPSANGTLQLQAANETATNNVTVRQGSCGFLYPL